MLNNSTIPKIIAVLGPTAVGKSKFAIELAQKIDAEIISADSIQIYRYFDIGTSKPSHAERRSVPHHLIDIRYPDQDFSAGSYREAATRIINELSRKNRRIIIVGGSFLYIRVLLSGLIENVPANADVRKEIEKVKSEKGTEYLYNELRQIDADYTDKINRNDFIRIQRALEVYYLTGTKISELHKTHGFSGNEYNALRLALYSDPERLNGIINNRVDTIMQKGLVEEVRYIRSLGYSKDAKPMGSIGYKEINQYLDSEIDFEEAVELIKRNTRRFAKRQMTWIRGEDDLRWYEIEREKEKLMQDCLDFYGL